MRPALRWLMAGTLVLTAVSLWPRKPPASSVVGAIERSPVTPSNAAPSGNEAPLRTTLEPWLIEAARRDAFAPADAPAPQPETQSAPQAAAPSPAPPPPPPTAPAVTYRYLGRMKTPEGRVLTLLARGDTTVPVAAGTSLDEGYVVESVSEHAVRLVYPSLGTVVDIPVPPAPPPAR